jgi:enoyl-CoA hydratase
MYNNLLIENNESIRIITINRPTQLNALNKETIEELHTELTAARNDNSVRAIIITSVWTKESASAQ